QGLVGPRAAAGQNRVLAGPRRRPERLGVDLVGHSVRGYGGRVVSGVGIRLSRLRPARQPCLAWWAGRATSTDAAAGGPIKFSSASPPRTTGEPMGFDQYHEPPEELPPATRTFARLCASLTEEAEAIGWYEQRIAVETDPEALAVMRDAQGEEFKHFSMDLEFLLRRT